VGATGIESASSPAAKTFDEHLDPILEQAGIFRPTPERWPVHSLLER
jgi:hypothetical protein